MNYYIEWIWGTVGSRQRLRSVITCMSFVLKPVDSLTWMKLIHIYLLLSL